jgi:hypothetical protein
VNRASREALLARVTLVLTDQKVLLDLLVTLVLLALKVTRVTLVLPDQKVLLDLLVTLVLLALKVTRVTLVL